MNELIRLNEKHDLLLRLTIWNMILGFWYPILCVVAIGNLIRAIMVLTVQEWTKPPNWIWVVVMVSANVLLPIGLVVYMVTSC